MGARSHLRAAVVALPVLGGRVVVGPELVQQLLKGNLRRVIHHLGGEGRAAGEERCAAERERAVSPGLPPLPCTLCAAAPAPHVTHHTIPAALEPAHTRPCLPRVRPWPNVHPPWATAYPHLDDLCVSGAPAADLLVGGVVHLALAVADLGCDHAWVGREEGGGRDGCVGESSGLHSAAAGALGPGCSRPRSRPRLRWSRGRRPVGGGQRPRER